MADLQIKRVRLRNWEKVKTADLEFPEKGLVLVIGNNLASLGKLQSVGSGKTSLGEAISRAMTGVAGRFPELGHYAPDDKPTNLFVAVEATLLGKPLLVEMGYKCPELSKTGEGLRFTYDGKTIQRGHVDQTREELSRALRVTPELANWTVFLDGDKLRFNKMSQQDSVELLMMALAQPMNQYHDQATKVLGNARRQVAVADQALASAKARGEHHRRSLEDACADHEEAKTEYQRQVDELGDRVLELKRANVNDKNSVEAAEATIKKAKKQLTLLEEQHAAANHQLDIKRQALRDEMALVDVDWLAAAETRSAHVANKKAAVRTLTEMEAVPKNCPTCGKPWDSAHSEKELAKAKAAVEASRLEVTAADTAYAALDTKRKAVYKQITDIEAQINNTGHLDETRTLNTQVSRNDRLIRDLNATIQARELKIISLGKGVDPAEVNRKAAVVEERQRALNEGRAAIEKAAEDLAGEEELFRICEYWQKAFGPTGISNMLLSDAIGPLNRVAQRISNLMTGGTLHVSYSTRRELASGDSKAQLIIKVDNKLGSKRVEGSSKGEAGLTNLIIAENLSEIGQVSQRVGFRWYDEITGGQDPVVRRAIFSYLKDVAQRLGILIFVVDHHVEASSYADYVLMAEKTVENGTRFFWK